jgi:hypothetical protein
MKVSEFKNRILENVCPLCGNFSHFKIYLNGGECRHPDHNNVEFGFYTGSDKKIIKLGVVDGVTEVTFELLWDIIKMTEGEKTIRLPFLDVTLENVTYKSMKELLVFT